MEDQPDDDVIKAKVKAGAYKLSAGVDPLAADLLRWMLKAQPAHRATIPEIVNHPWFEQPDLPVDKPASGSTVVAASNDTSDMTTMVSEGNTSSTEFVAPSPAVLPRLAADLRGDSLEKSLHSVSRRPSVQMPSPSQLLSLPRIGKTDSLERSMHEKSPRSGRMFMLSPEGATVDGGGQLNADDKWARTVRSSQNSQQFTSLRITGSERGPTSSTSTQLTGMPKLSPTEDVVDFVGQPGPANRHA